ncbi:MAG: hypothetical protein K9L99_05855 [Candidatus Omnitrophica bacterium]|nr:hypothetical protein [Candidatus Omnitrophota bacterium]
MKRKMKRKNKKTLENKLDKLWAEAIKLRAGYRCEYCGNINNLNSHHIFTRSRKATRWELNNGVCLCVSCHTFSSKFSAHKAPIEFTHWLEKTRGVKWLKILENMSNEVYKPTIEDLEETEKYLQDYVKKFHKN